ncbi:MAG: glucose-1-phosphate thymidylyltransferase [bacterium]|nr:glucose-1-phosphate thymidylyltransferase [bacterium]
MKAVILAAGQGTRLRPVTLTMPKPLVPVANRPLIAYAIHVLKNAGLNEIGIVVSDLSSPIVAGLGDGSHYGVKLTYLVQEKQLGLAHAVGVTREFVGDEPFCVYLGDNIFQDPMEQLLREFPASSAECVIGLGEVNDPTRFGIAKITDGQIEYVVEKPADPPSNLAIVGVYLFRKSIFDAISRIQPSRRGEYEITDAIQELIASGAPVRPYTLSGWWIDAGKPDSIILANQLVLGDLPYTAKIEDPAIVQGSSDVSARVVVGENSRIIDSVVRGPVIIGSNVTIRSSFVGPYTALGDNVTLEHSEIESSIVMTNCTISGIPGRIDASLIADNSQVMSGQRLPSTHRLILAENSYVHL